MVKSKIEKQKIAEYHLNRFLDLYSMVVKGSFTKNLNSERRILKNYFPRAEKSKRLFIIDKK